MTACMQVLLTFALGVLPPPCGTPRSPAGAPTPGGRALPAMAGRPAPGAPVISAVSEITHPGETLVITGQGLVDASLKVWAEGVLADIAPLRAVDDRMQAIVPPSTPASTMLVWPIRGEQVGAPIRVNGPAAWWLWPCRVAMGQDKTVRVFGKNLAAAGAAPVAWLAGPSGAGRRLAIASHDAYHVEARLPDGLAPGSYRVCVHNGTGGAYGWSDPVTFEAVKPAPVPQKVFRVDSFGPRWRHDENVHKALAAAVAHGGGVVQFGQGNYTIQRPIVVPEGVPIVLRGVGMGAFDEACNRLSGPHTLVTDLHGGLDNQFRGNTLIELIGRGSRVEDMTILMGSLCGAPAKKGRGAPPWIVQHTNRAIWLLGPDQAVVRTRLLVVAGGTKLIHCDYAGQANHRIRDCEFYLVNHGVLVADGADFVRISGCRFVGRFAAGRNLTCNAVNNAGGNNVIVERCRFQSQDMARARMLDRSCLLYNNSIRNQYLAHNHTERVGPHRSILGADFNSAEQYLFHSRGPKGGAFDVADAGPASVTLAADAAALPKELARDQRWVVFVCAGRGVGQWRIVTGQQATRLGLKTPWRLRPARGSRVVLQRVFRWNLVVHNVVDAVPDTELIPDCGKTVGVFWFHSCFDNVAAGNVFRNIGVGVSMTCRRDTPNAWNVTRDNRMAHVAGRAGDAAYASVCYADLFYSSNDRTVTQTDRWCGVGNVFRANRCDGVTGAAAQVAFLRYAKYKDEGYEPGVDRGLVMSVIENNTFTRCRRGILLGSPANWTLVRNNRIDLIEAGVPTVECKSPRKIVAPLIEE